MANFYRIPNSNDKLFATNLETLLKIGEKFDFCVFGVDQNYDLLRLASYKPSQEFVTTMNIHKYIATICIPTRVTHTTSMLIDNIFVKNHHVNKHCSFVITDCMSDHFPCLLKYELPEVSKNKTEVCIEKSKITDEAIFNIQHDLLFHDWSIVHTLDTNKGYQYLIEVITKSMDKHAPKKRIKLRACDKFREPWMTVQIKRYNVKSRKLCEKAHRSSEKSDHERYKKYRNVLRRIKSHVKREHYDQLFKKIGKNSQLLWSVVNSMIHKTHNRNEVTELNYAGQVLTKRTDICNALNEHFANAGKKVKDTIRESNGEKTEQDYVKRVTNCLLFSPVREMYVCKIVNSLKSKSSTGNDYISNVLLKRLIHVIKTPLCIIFNRSLMDGEFPELMKTAKIVPLHKGGLKNIADNYRPISLLPVISKVLERIVYNYMLVHLSKISILFPKQFSFRKGHSTSDGIMGLLADVLNSIDKKFMVLSVFIDLKKAFDTVSHDLILKKLIMLGIKGKEIEWFKSYMSNRKQFVQLDDVSSEKKNVTVGVQQGSLLGVLLFQLLINDLPNCLKFCTCILYADDTTLYIFGKSLKFLRSKMQADLDQLQLWLTVNSLKLNVGKTKVMLFSADGINPKIDLLLDNELVENVQSFKFLGLSLDSELTFEQHYSELYRKLSQAVFLIKKMGTVVPKSCLRTLYFAYFHSNLCYCLLLWFPLLKKKQQEALYVLQKRVIRALADAGPHQHCMPFFKRFEILTVYDQLWLENCKLIYRTTHIDCPVSISNLFESSNRQHNTRSGSLNIAVHSSVKFNNSFLYKPIVSWSKLSTALKTVNNKRNFVKELKGVCFKQY